MTANEKRKPLNRRQVIEIMLRQEGRCGCGCGEKLQPMTEGVIDEHVLAIGLRPDDPNDIGNRALYRKPCAASKTKGDVKAIARAKRREARDNGTRRPRKPIPAHINPWPAKGTRKIHSRPFPGGKHRDAER
jgi:hypothetical protein